MKLQAQKKNLSFTIIFLYLECKLCCMAIEWNILPIFTLSCARANPTKKIVFIIFPLLAIKLVHFIVESNFSFLTTYKLSSLTPRIGNFWNIPVFLTVDRLSTFDRLSKMYRNIRLLIINFPGTFSRNYSKNQNSYGNAWAYNVHKELWGLDTVLKLFRLFWGGVGLGWCW